MNLRHGDLVFTPIETPKEGKVRELNEEYILAFGEATGHAHRLRGKSIKVVDLPDQEAILEIGEEASLSHEEHVTIKFPAGLYLMRREREHDYFTESIRTVAD